MKNSAWYHKLWRQKLDKLPVKQDAGAAWANMKGMLDKSMPVSGVTARPVKPLGAKLSSLLTYIVPVAAILGTGVYFLQLKHKTNKPHQPKHKVEVSSFRDSLIKTDSLAKDSLSAQKVLSDTNDVQFSGSPVNQLAPGLVNSGIKVNKQQGQAAILQQATQAQQSGNVVYQSNTSFSNAPKNGGGYAFLAPAQQITNVTYTHQEASNIAMQSAGFELVNSDQPNSAALTQQQLNKGTTSSVDNANQSATNVKNSGKTTDGEKAGTLIKVNKNKAGVFKAKKASGKRLPADLHTPPYNYGLEFGFNTGGGNNNLYFGVFGTYALTPRWLVNAGFRFNGTRQFSKEYSHPSYYKPDSLPPFKVIDAPKVWVAEVPITMEYKVSRLISIKAGPVISLAIKQSTSGSSLVVSDRRDTLNNSKQINAIIAGSTVSKVNVGFTGGVSFHFRRFDIDGRYQMMTPYKLSSDLGSYRKSNQTFQVGIGYRFK
ncbi:outer membrane beta-barrel protein [Mucilaginibacter sp. SP1R1]|uniref:outer membrane beta-barrel protein n=1 Tax=Mucilaginibacter sp. SP1R1 TaxID=2723091 RepID=UPI00160D34F7|nr:outer membrane beta-barrel protein [Mucilaginibacter sp. SP1R1]MBB6150631.1 hypothetical protein [Mucilaginibacter sp. SP1R1]